VRRADNLDGLCRRMHSLIRNAKFAEAAQEFADPSCEVFVNGKAAGIGKSTIKKLAEAWSGQDVKVDLVHHTVAEDDRSYSEWKLVSGTSEHAGVLVCEWQNNSVACLKIFGL
jgi:hypothetical protein